jgi:hypothetical protein
MIATHVVDVRSIAIKGYGWPEYLSRKFCRSWKTEMQQTHHASNILTTMDEAFESGI